MICNFFEIDDMQHYVLMICKIFDFDRATDFYIGVKILPWIAGDETSPLRLFKEIVLNLYIGIIQPHLSRKISPKSVCRGAVSAPAKLPPNLESKKTYYIPQK